LAIIRAATDKDIPRIIELYYQLVIAYTETEQHRTPSDDDYKRVLAEISAQSGHELLVMEYEGKVVGTMVFILVPNLSHQALPWALVENVIVDAAYRRRGLGKLLMEHAVKKAKDAGCFKIALSSDTKRQEAHRFYQCLGFGPTAIGFRRYF